MVNKERGYDKQQNMFVKNSAPRSDLQTPGRMQTQGRHTTNSLNMYHFKTIPNKPDSPGLGSCRPLTKKRSDSNLRNLESSRGGTIRTTSSLGRRQAKTPLSGKTLQEYYGNPWTNSNITRCGTPGTITRRANKHFKHG